MKKGRWGSAKKTYSVSPADYRLQEEVGNGSSATVYRALYLPYNEIVAVKCMDLDRCSSNLDDIRREAQTMSLIDHPSVVKGYCSFVVERFLWVVMPFLAEGSCLHLMKSAYPDGFEEYAIGSILKETLKALEYLHKHGHIHRDVKAGNILLDSSGAVKLGDFGVTACMFDKGDRQRSRNTFVGTPCWMAPEVLQPGGEYDFKADIWSLGITALELAHGHAPFSKYPPMKVLLMTLQNAPPGLDYDRDKRFSKSFKEMVAMCLVKDQKKRPSAHKLLKHYFFKNAKPSELSMKSLLADLPPLWDRVKELQLKDAEQLAMKKMPSLEQEALSQSEYQRGVSAWNFDMEDLKIQASLIQDDDDLFDTREVDSNSKHFINNKEPSILRPSTGKTLVAVETAHRYEGENQILAGKPRHDARRDPNLSGPLLLPRRASANSLSAPLLSSGYADSMEDKSRANVVQIKGRFSVTSENVDLVKDVPLCNIPQIQCQRYPLRKSASVGHSLVNSQQAHVNQFKSENIKSSLPASILIPHLQNLFQQSSFQQDLLSNLLNGLQQNELVSTFQTGMPSQTSEPNTDLWADSAVSERERILLVKIAELQSRIILLTEELTAARLKHIPLQQQLKDIHSEGERRENALRMP